ncbi:MAG: hypothetical protein NUW24_15370 [Anaerolineae bacterium]|jgi:hypothetical protein|nr:hypothetical protein [Anaerolineae bacterium]MDH7474951.1 hypothetical protein [Anaerolineae bacterium]
MTTLELELVELRARVERLETQVRQLVGDRHGVVPPTPGEPLDQEQLIAWLRAEGLVRDPTPEERRLAAEWDALPEEEKEAHIRFMRSLVLDPPLSRIIIENRR